MSAWESDFVYFVWSVVAHALGTSGSALQVFFCTPLAFSVQRQPDRWIATWHKNAPHPPLLILSLFSSSSVQIIHRVGPRYGSPLFFFLLPRFSLIEKQERDARGDVWRDRQREKGNLQPSRFKGPALCEAGRVRSVLSHQPAGTRETERQRDYAERQQKLWNNGRVLLIKCHRCLLLMTSPTLCL